MLVDLVHTTTRDGVRLERFDCRAVEPDRARVRRHDAHQGFERRRFAGAVAAQKRHHLVALDVERDIEQNVRVAVIAVEHLDLEQAHAACTPPR